MSSEDTRAIICYLRVWRTLRRNRTAAVVLSLSGGISVMAGILGGLVALVLYPVLVVMAGAMLIVGLGDTWLNVRARMKARGDRQSPGNGEF